MAQCRKLLQRSRQWVAFKADSFRNALSCSLEFLGAPPLAPSSGPAGQSAWKFPPLDGQAAADATWTATLDSLRAPQKLDQKLADWRRDAPIRPAVQARLAALLAGHELWCKDRKTRRAFPGGPYILLHTLSHLLIQSLAMRCGYPATSIRERVYVEGERYGILLYTGSPDAEGTLGGLVQQARRIEEHLEQACRAAALCSNDPICAQHAPETTLEGHLLLGAACHACTLVAETSCEMRNDYLDRALVVPVIGLEDAAFFPAPT